MTPTTKQGVITVFRVLNAVLLVFMVILTFRVLGRIAEQARANHDDTAAAVKQIEADHDRQNAYLQCLVNLFLGPTDELPTPKQNSACLAKAKSDPTPVSTQSSPASSTSTTPYTDPVVTSSPASQTNNPPQQATTAAPPDPPTQRPPSLIEQLTTPITDLVKGVI